MASTGKRKTTMAKLTRESRVRERRLEKQARKRARQEAAASAPSQPDEPSAEPAMTEPTTPHRAQPADSPS